MTKLLIFDWDGTLCDSLDRIAICLQLAAADAGLEVPTEKAAKDVVGLGLVDVMKRLFPEAGDQQTRLLCERYSQHFIERDSQPSPLFAGVEAALAEFKQQGCLLAVATGKSRRGLNRVFEASGYGEFFHSSRCADETASKPDPLMLLQLLEEFALSPEDALMVGDTAFDMEMAMLAGIPRLAVSYGAHSAEQMAPYNPLSCSDSFASAKAFINQLTK